MSSYREEMAFIKAKRKGIIEQREPVARSKKRIKGEWCVLWYFALLAKPGETVKPHVMNRVDSEVVAQKLVERNRGYGWHYCHVSVLHLYR